MRQRILLGAIGGGGLSLGLILPAGLFFGVNIGLFITLCSSGSFFGAAGWLLVGALVPAGRLPTWLRHTLIGASWGLLLAILLIIIPLGNIDLAGQIARNRPLVVGAGVVIWALAGWLAGVLAGAIGWE